MKNKSYKRVLGSYDMDRPGPTLVCICGIHGNEHAGVKAFMQLIRDLKNISPDFNGKIFGFAANITALTDNVRYVDEDLNRIWSSDRITKIAQLEDSNSLEKLEYLEQKFLWAHISACIEESNGPVYFIDLHTTSSESEPFITINDTLRNRNFALKFPIPIVLGLEEHLNGTLIDYVNDLGFIGIGIEGGQHLSEASAENHLSAIWMALAIIGCIDPHQIDVSHYLNRLSKTTTNGRKIFEIRHRHNIKNEDVFKMKDGFVNFQNIHKKQTLAIANGKEIPASETGKVLMPLYQELGNDGFFIVREVKFFWLRVSESLRKKRFHRFLQLMPGVNRYNGNENTLVVNTRIARWFVKDIFHLLGFRRKLEEGNKMIFTRVAYDIDPPEVVLDV